MKRCNKCGAQLYDQDNVCTYCGSAEISTVGAPEQAYNQQPVNNAGPVQENGGNENIIAGVVGAFLFALLGGVLYFLIYQLGIIAGVCGLVMFVLANFGYNLFAKPGNKNSTVGLVVSIIAMAVMIYLSEYFCISFEIFQIYKDQGITIFDAIRAMPSFLEEPAIKDAFAGDLVFAYIFGVIASLGNIASIAKSKKKK